MWSESRLFNLEGFRCLNDKQWKMDKLWSVHILSRKLTSTKYVSDEKIGYKQSIRPSGRFLGYDHRQRLKYTFLFSNTSYTYLDLGKWTWRGPLENSRQENIIALANTASEYNWRLLS